jgi:hypothetical protein
MKKKNKKKIESAYLAGALGLLVEAKKLGIDSEIESSLLEFIELIPVEIEVLNDVLKYLQRFDGELYRDIDEVNQIIWAADKFKRENNGYAVSPPLAVHKTE